MATKKITERQKVLIQIRRKKIKNQWKPNIKNQAKTLEKIREKVRN